MAAEGRYGSVPADVAGPLRAYQALKCLESFSPWR